VRLSRLRNLCRSKNIERELSFFETGTPALHAFSTMNSDRLFEAAIGTAKNLLGQNLQPKHLPDAATVLRLRELVHSPSIRSALLHSSDTLPAFALRAVEHVVADQSQTDREIITRLWDILDDPHLNRALGITQNSRFMLGPHTKRVDSICILTELAPA
jgi:hypothetical protein